MLELCEVSISIVLRNDHPRYRPNMLLNLSSSLSITIVFVFCPLAYASLFVIRYLSFAICLPSL
jgi:hypothetical protein